MFAHLDQDLSGPVTPQSGRHPLPSAAALVAFLGAAGVDEGTDVVAYDQDKSPYAARLWWLLRWLGSEHVAVLNGGLAGWRAAGLPLEAAAPRRSARVFRARAPLAQVATTAEVERDLAAGTTLLLDARGADRFAGRNETIDPVAGHVPGARSFSVHAKPRRRWPLQGGDGACRGVAGSARRRSGFPSDRDVRLRRHGLPQSAGHAAGRIIRSAAVRRIVQRMDPRSRPPGRDRTGVTRASSG